MAVQAIVFDLDETLSDRSSALERFIDLWIGTYFNGRSQDPDTLRTVFRRLDSNGYRPKEEVYRLLVEELGWSDPPTETAYIRFWQEHFPTLAMPMDGVHETLDYLRSRGLKLGLITNGKETVQRGKIDRLAIDHYFDSIVISGAVGVKKPDGSIFARSLEELGVTAEQSWYVGDHPINDVRGSLEAGMTPVWMTRGEAWNDEEHAAKPAHTIQSLRELVALYESFQ